MILASTAPAVPPAIKDTYGGFGPKTKALSLYNGLNQMESSVLMQLRTGKIGLKAYLKSIGRADSDRCACNQAPKTPHHIILDCPLYDNLQHHTFRDAF